MPLKKLQLKPGVNRENTRYTTEGGWYESDKVRFRQGMPEKIGGWERISANTFLGVCRSLWNWITLGGQNLISVGTTLKYYIERGGNYYDITPIRLTTVAGAVTFAARIVLPPSSTLTVTNVSHGANAGDFVTFSGAVSLGGTITAAVLNQEYEISTVLTDDTYTVAAKNTSGVAVTANGSDTGNGGAAVIGTYQINTGSATAVPFSGWGSGGWGLGTWGYSNASSSAIRLWSQSNYGEDLVFAYRGGPIFYWDASSGTSVRGKTIDTTNYPLAVDAPTIVNIVSVSDIYRFVFAFGANPLGTTTQDPMLIRWSNQEDVFDWAVTATGTAGSIRVSHGTEIIAVVQARQEVLVWTDSALYSMQYLGGDIVWNAQLMGDNISVASQNATAYAGSTAYWMGRDKFYKYDGSVMTLPCNVKRYIFNDINTAQFSQVVSGTNEGFNEVWWFYCSAGVIANDRYVVYNYLEDIWYYGNIARTAWLDSGLRDRPIAATYSSNLVDHEKGNDDLQTAVTTAIVASITSSEFDLDDGHSFVLINRMLPDVTFDGSSAAAPAAIMTLSPMSNSGSGYNNPLSVGGNSASTVTRSATVPIEAFTGQVYIRIRGRQLAFKMESTAIGVAWQLGVPRLDMRPDGRR